MLLCVEMIVFANFSHYLDANLGTAAAPIENSRLLWPQVDCRDRFSGSVKAGQMAGKVTHILLSPSHF